LSQTMGLTCAAILLVVLIGLPTSISCGTREREPSPFPDRLLDAAVRQELKRDKGPLYPEDCEPLTRLFQWHKNEPSGISDLTGLEHCTNLTFINLGFNKIRSVAPVSSLVELNDLSLNRNEIDDISPLSSLVNLTSLDLSGNKIRDVTPLSSLSRLERLYLHDNQVADITPLSSLTSLRTLDLSENAITDITPLLDNPGLGQGDAIELDGNKLDLTPGSDDMNNIHALEARGVVVKYR